MWGSGLLDKKDRREIYGYVCVVIMSVELYASQRKKSVLMSE